MTVKFTAPEPFAKKIKGIFCNTRTSYCLVCRHYATRGNEYLFMTRGGHFWILTPAREVFLIDPYEAACYREGLFVPFFLGRSGFARFSLPYGEGVVPKTWAAAPVPELSAAAKKAVEHHSLPLPEAVKERIEKFKKTGKIDEGCTRSLLFEAEDLSLAAKGLER